MLEAVLSVLCSPPSSGDLNQNESPAGQRLLMDLRFTPILRQAAIFLFRIHCYQDIASVNCRRLRAVCKLNAVIVHVLADHLLQLQLLGKDEYYARSG